MGVMGVLGFLGEMQVLKFFSWCFKKHTFLKISKRFNLSLPYNYYERNDIFLIFSFILYYR